MIDVDKPVIFDCVVDQKENCFPMIPSGRAHNEMILGDSGGERRRRDHRRRQDAGVTHPAVMRRAGGASSNRDPSVSDEAWIAGLARQ